MSCILLGSCRFFVQNLTFCVFLTKKRAIYPASNECNTQIIFRTLIKAQNACNLVPKNQNSTFFVQSSIFLLHSQQCSLSSLLKLIFSLFSSLKFRALTARSQEQFPYWGSKQLCFILFPLVKVSFFVKNLILIALSNSQYFRQCYPKWFIWCDILNFVRLFVAFLLFSFEYFSIFC